MFCKMKSWFQIEIGMSSSRIFLHWPQTPANPQTKAFTLRASPASPDNLILVLTSLKPWFRAEYKSYLSIYTAATQSPDHKINSCICCRKMLEVSKAAPKYEWLQCLGKNEASDMDKTNQISAKRFLCISGYQSHHLCSLFCAQAEAICLNPLYVMLPCALSASLAFMLPVATPPNAIVFSFGQLKVMDMVRKKSPKNNTFFPEFSPLGLIFPFPTAGSSWGSIRKVSVPGLCQVEGRCACINKGSHCP